MIDYGQTLQVKRGGEWATVREGIVNNREIAQERLIRIRQTEGVDYRFVWTRPS